MCSFIIINELIHLSVMAATNQSMEYATTAASAATALMKDSTCAGKLKQLQLQSHLPPPKKC